MYASPSCFTHESSFTCDLASKVNTIPDGFVASFQQCVHYAASIFELGQQQTTWSPAHNMEQHV